MLICSLHPKRSNISLKNEAVNRGSRSEIITESMNSKDVVQVQERCTLQLQYWTLSVSNEHTLFDDRQTSAQRHFLASFLVGP